MLCAETGTATVATATATAGSSEPKCMGSSTGFETRVAVNLTRRQRVDLSDKPSPDWPVTPRATWARQLIPRRGRGRDRGAEQVAAQHVGQPMTVEVGPAKP